MADQASTGSNFRRLLFVSGSEMAGTQPPHRAGGTEPIPLRHPPAPRNGRGGSRPGMWTLGTLVLICGLALAAVTLAPGTQLVTPAGVETSLGSGADGQVDLGTAVDYAAGRGTVAMAVLDRRTGIYLDSGDTAQKVMGSASVIKVLLAEELLYQASRGQIALGPSEFAGIEAMLIYSDDSAASSLYSEFGGVSLIQAGLDRLGMTESGPPENPRFWGNTMITARDVVRLYDDMLNGSLPVDDRDYMVNLLRQMAPIADDGFDQEFGLAAHDSSVAGVKQGWMCCMDGMRNVHSTAIVGPDNRYIVVILTQYEEVLPYEYGQITATEVARLILDQLPG